MTQFSVSLPEVAERTRGFFALVRECIEAKRGFPLVRILDLIPMTPAKSAVDQLTRLGSVEIDGQTIRHTLPGPVNCLFGNEKLGVLTVTVPADIVVDFAMDSDGQSLVLRTPFQLTFCKADFVPGVQQSLELGQVYLQDQVGVRIDCRNPGAPATASKSPCDSTPAPAPSP